jgi:anaerobic selenocysteine-containing dehydrogenase
MKILSIELPTALWSHDPSLALKALEFFAHADLFMTPTAELADIVLPVASSFERGG